MRSSERRWKWQWVACISDKIREAILRRYDHTMGREDENSTRRITCTTAEVNGRRSRGRQKKRWGDITQQDMKSRRLKEEHTADRKKLRGRIQVADCEGLIQAGRRFRYVPMSVGVS